MDDFCIVFSDEVATVSKGRLEEDGSKIAIPIDASVFILNAANQNNQNFGEARWSSISLIFQLSIQPFT